MSWEDVYRRDLTSVYRARTGTAVAALMGLSTVGVASLLALATSQILVAALGALVVVVAVAALVFLGDPRSVAGAVLVFACFSMAMATLFPDPGREPPSAEAAVLVIGSVLSFVLPLVALLASYAALVGERETGSVRFLFGLPNSRDDAYLGKYLSRSAVVAGTAVAGLVVSALVAGFTFAPSAFPALLGLALLSVPYGLLFVGVGLSASAYADTDNRAVALSVAAFVVLRAGWPALQWLGLQGLEDPYPRPEWYFWVGRVNPMNAFAKLTTLFVGRADSQPLITTPSTYEGPTAAARSLATTHGFAAVVLLAWTVAAPLAGLWYYRRRDLL